MSHGVPSSSLLVWMPWTDRAGRISWLKLAVFLATLAPLIWMAVKWNYDLYSAKPLTDAIRESGDWSLRILVASLAVTPLRFIFKWNRLILVRRMLGLAALAYALLHVALYCVDLHFAWLQIVTEIAMRLFLTVGFMATVLLVLLGITSNDFSIKRLGGAGWNRLHTWAYATALLSLLHYFMEVRLDAYEAVLLAGVFALLMIYRGLRKRHFAPSVWNLLWVSVACAAATAITEAIYYSIATNFPAQRVLLANLDFDYSIRPTWWVLAVGLSVTLAALVRDYFARSKAQG